MKLLQAGRLGLKITHKNGLIEKLLSWFMPMKNCFQSLKNQSLTLMKKITKVQNLLRKKERKFYETNLR